MPIAVVDLTEMVRLVMQRPQHSSLFQAWEGRLFTWAVSEQMLAEFIEVTNRSRLQQMIRPSVRDAVVEALRTRCRFVVPATKFPPCRDPKDNLVIATAIAAQANFIVTTDLDLLDDETLQAALAEHNLQVVYPAEFLKLLDK
jgi:putative PIN family toxin of toxin-antitoxin system